MSDTYLNICTKWSNDFSIIARVGIIKRRTIQTSQKLHQLTVPNLCSQKKAIMKYIAMKYVCDISLTIGGHDCVEVDSKVVVYYCLLTVARATWPYLLQIEGLINIPC